MRLPILDSIVISVSLPVLKDRTGKLCAKKVLCLAGFVLLLAAANYNAEAATVGFTDVFGGMTTAATRRAMPFTMPEYGTITSVSMYHYEYSGEDKYMLLGVYSDTGSDRPGERLALTQETITSHSTGWQTIDLINLVFVAGGADIWLAWVYEENPGIFYRSGSPSRADSGVLWNSPPRMPDPFGESTIGGTQYSIYATYTLGPPDTVPPTPTTSTWDSEPAATGPFSISMTATEATDSSGVEYYFDFNETDGGPGGDDSGWQDNRTYTNFGLSPQTEYTYRVRTRDKSPAQNTGNWSTSESATTPEAPPPAEGCPENDLNGDCAINWEDLKCLTDQWLVPDCTSIPPGCACADLDGHTLVDFDDFALLAEDWGKGGIDVVINELMAENDDYIQDPCGEYDDWFEIYNPTGSPIDIAGMWVEDADRPAWQIPAGYPETIIDPCGYLVLWADRDMQQGPLHVDFKLGAGGDTISLYANDNGQPGTLIDTVTFDDDDVLPDYSYGRFPDAFDSWYTMDEPTPWLPNTIGMAEPPYFSHPSGTFSTNFSLGLTTKSPTAQIYYTTDRSIPTDSSTIYSGPISIGTSSTTVIRARAYDAGLQAGSVKTQSYIPLAGDVQSFNSNLPVVVLDTFGFNIDTENNPGIHYPYRSVASAFIDTDEATGRAAITGLADFTGRAGLKVRGDSSSGAWVYWPKRQYSFETWTEADGEEDKNVSIFGFPPDSDWIIHAPFSDKTLMRNVLAYKWSNDMGHWAARTRFVELFLNKNGNNVSMDDYWGVYVFMEKIRISDDRVDIVHIAPSDDAEPEITGGYIIKHDKNPLGDETFVTSANWTGPFLYHEPDDAEITSAQKTWIRGYLNDFESVLGGSGYADPVTGYAAYIDVDSFIDFDLMAEIEKQVDVYTYSTYLHKDREGKLNMGPVWDFNLTLGNAYGPAPGGWYYPENSRDCPGWYHDELGSSYSWNARLMEDDEYNRRFSDRWFELREGVFSDGGIQSDIDYYYNLLNAEAATRNSNRWQIYVDPDTGMQIESGGVWAPLLNCWVWPNYYWGAPNNPHTYQMEVDWIKTWLTGYGTPPGSYSDRVDWLDNNMPFGLPPVFYVEGVPMNTGGHADAGDELTMDKGGAPGTIYYTLDGTDPREPFTGNAVGTVYTAPITLNASVQVKARIKDSSNWSALNSATFAVGPVAEDLRITEMMYHPQDTGDPINDPNAEFIELKNIHGSTTINLNLVKFTDGIDFTFPDISLNAGDYIIVVKDQDVFTARYGGGFNIAGEYTGRLNNAGERIELQDAFGQIIHNFGFKDGWYHITDGSGFSLSIIDPTSNDPNKWEYSEGWQASSVIKGTPGADDTGHVAAPGDIVINEVLTHTDTPPNDWIELHNTTGSTIDISGWFLSDNDNNFKKYQIAASTSIPAGGYKVFTEDDHFGSAFALSEHGETVYLSSGSGGELAGGYCAKEDFKASEDEVSFGRYTKSAAAGYDVDFVSMAGASSGGANGSPKVGPVVITEIMYHPASNNYAEYVEIKNISGTTVSLTDWRLTDETGGIEYYIPSGTSLTAGQYLLLTKNKVALNEEFTPAAVTILEWVEGRLSNAGEKIQISKPGDPEPDFVPYIRVDRVNYSDGSHGENFRELNYNDPWPTAPDGTGQALERITDGNYGNDVANWQAATPSPGS